MIKKAVNLSPEFKKLYMNEIELYLKYFKDKVKDDACINQEEIDEAVEMIRNNLSKIMQLGGVDE